MGTRWEQASGSDDSGRPKKGTNRRWLIGVLAVLASLSSCSDDTPPRADAETLAKQACADARSIVKEAADGTRSKESAINALDPVTEDARDAALQDPKWQPLARTIIGAQMEIGSEGPSEDVAALLSNCGMPAGE